MLCRKERERAREREREVCSFVLVSVVLDGWMLSVTQGNLRSDLVITHTSSRGFGRFMNRLVIASMRDKTGYELLKDSLLAETTTLIGDEVAVPPIWTVQW